MELLDIIFSFFSLILLEIVLGIDNLVFLTILVSRLPKEQRAAARLWGLRGAWVTRLLLLFFVMFLVQWTTPLITVMGFQFSFRELVLAAGGVFLIFKAAQEMHDDVRLMVEKPKTIVPSKNSFQKVVLQIALMDVVFSLDSVLTAIGLSQHIWVMALAISGAIMVMIYASHIVGAFIEKHAIVKILALCFLMLVGVFLLADGFSFHIPRAYLYVAMGCSMLVALFYECRSKRDNGGGS